MFDRRHFLSGAAGLTVAACAGVPCTAELEAASGADMPVLTTGLDRTDELASLLKGKRVAVLTHAAGVNRAGERSIDVIARLPGVTLAAIWSPEHGLVGQAAAGDHVGDGRDAASGVPVYSLYGNRKAPTPAMLAAVDVVFVDLQDVGTRPYTYASTVLELLKAAAKSGTEVVLNDRPNPLGGVEIEGGILHPALVSFVGVWPIPLRHGLTLGELARMMNEERVAADRRPFTSPAPSTTLSPASSTTPATPIAARLVVLPMVGWQRTMGAAAFGPGGLPLVPPSPNLRSADAMLAYAGTVLFEGTSVSEGRGTPKPFETLCAPFLEPDRLRVDLPAALSFERTPGNPLPGPIPGATLSFGTITPNAARYKGQQCGAIHIHITDPARYKPVRTALRIMAALFLLYPKEMGFLPGKPPFFDRLVGDGAVRDDLQQGRKINAIEQGWQTGLDAFNARRTPFLLYR